MCRETTAPHTYFGIGVRTLISKHLSDRVRDLMLYREQHAFRAGTWTSTVLSPGLISALMVSVALGITGSL